MSHFISYSPGRRRDLPSFPTRRSSDLGDVQFLSVSGLHGGRGGGRRRGLRKKVKRKNQKEGERWESALHVDMRSEEHTSELQSRFDLVCRLLLEKKN